MEYNHSRDILVLAGIVIAIFALVCGLYISSYLPLKEKRDYIKMEMSRSHDKVSRRYWQKELKKLYFESIPFIRIFMKRKK